MIERHYYHPLTTLLYVRGILYLGERGEIRNGNQIIVYPNAILTISSNTIIGAYSKIYCHNSINIKDNVRISWNVQLFDTNFHYYLEDNNTIYRNMKNISIGTHCWIGNHVTFSKGSIGDYCIVASNSVLTKDYSLLNHTLFAGIPAKVLKMIKTRIFNYDIEEYLNNLFEEQKELDSVDAYQLPFLKIE